MTLNCLPTPMGCGREIPEEEFARWDSLSKTEFRLSQWCLDCQNNIFDDAGWIEEEL